jgi:hypothetical protein
MARSIVGYLRTNVLGVIAIFIALGGSAYAAGLAKNSVKSRQIKAGAVRNSDLADSAVTSPKVADGSLLAQDFASGQVPQGAIGPTGPTGPQGVTGQQGVQGDPATKLFAYIADFNGTTAASVGYGSGVDSVSDTAGDGGAYDVTFDRDVSGCTASVTPGLGHPSASASASLAWPLVEVMGGDKVRVTFARVQYNAGPPASISFPGLDTSFLIEVFC